MTHSYNQEADRNGDLSSSDDDSLSLLQDLSAWQNRGAAEVILTTDSGPEAEDKEMKKKTGVNINEHKAAEPVMSSRIQPTAGCAEPSSQSAKVSRCVKIPKTTLHKRNGKGETLLHTACKKRDLTQVKLLIQAGISVNMEDHAGWTALHEASAVGDEAVVEELLKAGADVNVRSCDGVTPLHDAVYSGHYQVVKRLLEFGSNASEKHIGGLTAFDMAKEESIRELLRTFQAPSVTHTKSCNASAQHRQPEPCCHEQLSCHSSCSYSETSDLQWRKAGGRDRTRGPGDFQLSGKDTNTHNVRALHYRLAAEAGFNPSHAEAITVVLEEVRRKQTEVSTWPLTSLKDAGRYRDALAEIQRVLIEVLAKQHSEKDKLARKYRSVPVCLRHCVLKGQLSSLAACQRTLMEMLQKHKHLVDAYITTKARLSPDSSKPRETRSCNEGSRKAAAQASLLRCAQTANSYTDAAQPGSALQHFKLMKRGKNALIQTRAKDNSRCLSKLIQGGVISPGGALQLLWKGHCHFAQVLADGSILSKGKVHLAPECWLESILGNNIPVGSAYAWDKVTFKSRPLSYYLLNMEAEGNTAQRSPEENCRERSSPETITTETGSFNHLMKIKIIHLVDDEELLPNALMDSYWDKLIKGESEDWES
ncbi:ankyrin repeat domain-containing protein 31-like [Archocentrus centrarchus]|uniref:ankyrin repeat domain-containing protein 31-like n=1 Tax=Archocentrus centrarchus TaxID=63155 RepID=UPI0011EA306F|nr:ankyrin repeat domain-containing protein 31-like [Archocentrus centrarchus]